MDSWCLRHENHRTDHADDLIQSSPGQKLLNLRQESSTGLIRHHHRSSWNTGVGPTLQVIIVVKKTRTPRQIEIVGYLTKNDYLSGAIDPDELLITLDCLRWSCSPFSARVVGQKSPSAPTPLEGGRQAFNPPAVITAIVTAMPLNSPVISWVINQRLPL